MINLIPGSSGDGWAFFDNLRSDANGVQRDLRPEIRQVTPAPDTVLQYQTLDLRIHVAFIGTLETPRILEAEPEPWDVGVQGRFAAPNGRELTVRGFLFGEANSKPGVILYGLRFTPDMPGTWRYQIGIQGARAWAWQEPRRFACRHANDSRGRIRIDPTDPTNFSFSNTRTPYYPMGQNIGWADDYEPYMRRIQDYAGNYLRIWICPWNLPMEEPGLNGRFNLESADAIDRIVQLADQYDVYLQLVLFNHTNMLGDWHRNPYNREIGGPCGDPREFWIAAAARQEFKRYLDYLTARWGHSPRLFAWELCNEADLAPAYDRKHIISWHREMSDHLRANAPYENLITASAHDYRKFRKIWKHANIDFLQAHWYEADLRSAFVNFETGFRRFAKPWFMAEFGRGWRAKTDQGDPQGRTLHQALWLAWMSRSAGNAMPWWWDTHIEPNNLYSHFAALIRYDTGEDRRGADFRPIRQQLLRGQGRSVHLCGLATYHSFFGYVFDVGDVLAPNAERLQPLLERTKILTIRDMMAGKYVYEVWDTYAGEVVQQERLNCAGSSLELKLPVSDRDFAIKLRRVETPSMRIKPTK